MNNYVGQERSLSLLKDNLTESRGSASFNILGAVGSGKSALLGYVHQKMLNRNDEWSFAGDVTAQVVQMDGQNYVRRTSFIGFFIEGLQRYFREEYEEIKRTERIEPLKDPSAIAHVLQQLTKNNIRLVIMIDNFANIMERLQPAEVHSLNYLKYANVNYLLVTDHRSVSEINKEVYSASTFFQDIIEIHLHPLLPHNAQQLVQQECENLASGCILTESDLRMLRELGGGNPGLLKELQRQLVIEKPLRGGNTEWDLRPLPEANRAILRLLHQGENVQNYLDKITNYLKNLTLSEQEVLIEIAMNRFSSQIYKVSHLFNYRMREHFLVLGLVTSEGVLMPLISGNLIQFTILQNLTDAPFSEAEEAAFNLLRENGTDLTSFEDLDTALNEFMPENVEEKWTRAKRDPRRRFIDGTMIRVRQKLEKANNRAAFVLENARGRGFYMYSRVSFDEFYEHGPEAFSR